MIKLFLKIIGAFPEETKPVLLLSGKGFFMGIFIATFEVGAETLFVNSLGEKYLDNAILVAGFLGVVFTLIFSALQHRIKYSRLLIGYYSFMLVYLLFMVFLFEYNQTEFLPFFLFMMLGPFVAIILLGFWGTFGRIFNLRQSKRIIGGIDTGQLTATLLAFFSIPFITGYLRQTSDLLLISIGALIMVTFFMFLIRKNFDIDTVTKVSKTQRKSVSFAKILKGKYTRLLSIFLIFSAMAVTIIEFGFLTSSNIMYPEENDLAKFLSFYGGAIIILNFLIQTFLNEKIIEMYGLRMALLLMPCILILFAVGAIIAGFTFGYQVRNEEFIFFFLFMALANLMSQSLKDALEEPSYKLFFMPLDVKIRFDIQSKIEGVINEFSGLISGGILTLFGLLSFFELIHYTFLVIAIAIVVIILSYKLYSQYRETLKETLQIKKGNVKVDEGDQKLSDQFLGKVLENQRGLEAQVALKLFDKIDPHGLDKRFPQFLRNPDPDVRRFALMQIMKKVNVSKIDLLESLHPQESDPELKELIRQNIQELKSEVRKNWSEDNIVKMIRSTNREHRVMAARIMGNAENKDKWIPFLLELMRDINTRVRNASLYAAGRLNHPELYPYLVEQLKHPSFANAASSALVEAGMDAFPVMESAFYKTGQSKLAQLRILQIYGRVGGTKANDFLLKKIDYPDKDILSQILKSLRLNKFKAYDFNAARIKIIIEETVGDIAWNYGAINFLKTEGDPLLEWICVALEEENKENFDNIYRLLAMIYEESSVFLVKENLNSGTSEGITFAMELLDVFLDDELKPKLVPILDDISVEERLEKLQNFYPPEFFENREEVLKQIVNRDYNHISKYSKTLALYAIGNLPDTSLSQDLVANLFNPDPVIRQTAAGAIFKMSKNMFYKYLRRVRDDHRRDLERTIDPPLYMEGKDAFKRILEVEKLQQLKKAEAFKRVPGVILYDLLPLAQERQVLKGHTIINENESGHPYLYLVYRGSLSVRQNDKELWKVMDGELIGEELIFYQEKSPYQVIAEENSQILRIDKEAFYEMAGQQAPIIEGIWQSICLSFEKQYFQKAS